MFAATEIAIVVTAKDQASQVVDKVSTGLKKWAPLMRAGAITTAALGATLIKLGRDTDRLEQSNQTYLTSLEKMELSVGKVLRPLEDMAPVLVTIAGLTMVLSMRAGRAAAAFLVEGAANVIATLATKAATAANVAYTLSIEALTGAVAIATLGIVALGAGVAAGLLVFQGAERRKRDELEKTNELIKTQTTTLQSELDKLKKEQESTWDDMTNAAQDAYDVAVTAARNFYGDITAEDNSLMAQERRRYQAEADAIDAKYGKIIAEYQAELDLLDNTSTEATRAYQDSQGQQEIDRLKGLRSVALTEAQKAELTDEINAKITEENQRHLQEQTEDKRTSLNEQIAEAQKKAQDEKASAKSASDDIIAGYNNQGLAAIKAAEDEKTAALDVVKVQKEQVLPVYAELQTALDEVNARMNTLEGKPNIDIKNIQDATAAINDLKAAMGGAETAAGQGTPVAEGLLGEDKRLFGFPIPGVTKNVSTWEWALPAWSAFLRGFGFVGQAKGGSGIVTKPTAFVAGEAGPEAYSFTPLSKMEGSQSPVAMIGYQPAGDTTEPTGYKMPSLVIQSLMKPKLMAKGGSGIVTKPTTFVAGEDEPEAYSFVPLSHTASPLVQSLLKPKTTNKVFGLAEDLAQMPIKRMAMGGYGIARKPTAFLAGETTPEAYSFTPVGQTAKTTGVAPYGVTYIDNRTIKLNVGNWMGDRQGIEELVDRIQPVMRARERWGTGKARY